MIRKIKQSDREPLNNILLSITQFTTADIEVAMELIDIAIQNPEQTDYNIYVFEHEEKVLGYHCTGKRPITDAVYDLYWIIADTKSNIKGIGTELLQHAENFVKEKNGRWLLAETSSKPSFEKTRMFYIKNNYTKIAEIEDFYTINDNLIIYGKKFLTK